MLARMPTPRALIDEAAFAFTLGDHAQALELLDQALAEAPDTFDAWLTKAEIHFDQRALDEALAAAERALALDPEQAHIHTTLSRIHMERGDKTQAEHHGAQARIKGWKVQLAGDDEA